MIIRDPQEDKRVTIIAQTDHSRLVGQIAAHWGNENFALPDPYDSVVRAAAFHDYGWLRYETSPLFDESTGEIFEFRRPPVTELHMDGYQWCTDWLLAADPFASLLVNRHRTGLWNNRYGVVKQPPHPHFPNLPGLIEDFVKRNEARQVEEMKTVDPQQFAIAYRLLQFWDILGLYFCCKEPVEQVMEPVPTKQSDGPQDGVLMKLTPVTPRKIRFDPYPFDEDGVHIQLLLRRLKHSDWRTPEEFRVDYFKAEIETIDFELVA